jgi:hypothetical protein
MKITQLTLFIILIVVSNAVSQNVKNTNRVIKSNLHGDIFETIDEELGDTTRYFHRTRRFIKKSKDNIVLIDGHKLGGMGTVCGCEPLPNGYWIEKYRNGNFKSQGRYNCGEKEGVWFFYHENGQISKIINWEKPYEKFATELSLDIDTLKDYYLRNGQYLEYHTNGQLKIKGEYEIIEEYSTTDTSYTMDMETFAMTGTIVKGDFWIPRSKKKGSWYVFDKAGNLIEQKYYSINENRKTRIIEHRYWEMMMKVFKEIEKHNKTSNNSTKNE